MRTCGDWIGRDGWEGREIRPAPWVGRYLVSHGGVSCLRCSTSGDESSDVRLWGIGSRVKLVTVCESSAGGKLGSEGRMYY